MIDGRRQRQALTAAEQALAALASGDAARARAAAARAASLDQVDAFAGLPVTVERAASDVEARGSVSREAWLALRATLGPGPLGFAVEARLAEGEHHD